MGKDGFAVEARYPLSPNLHFTVIQSFRIVHTAFTEVMVVFLLHVVGPREIQSVCTRFARWPSLAAPMAKLYSWESEELPTKKTASFCSGRPTTARVAGISSGRYKGSENYFMYRLLVVDDVLDALRLIETSWEATIARRNNC